MIPDCYSFIATARILVCVGPASEIDCRRDGDCLYSHQRLARQGQFPPCPVGSPRETDDQLQGSARLREVMAARFDCRESNQRKTRSTRDQLLGESPRLWLRAIQPWVQAKECASPGACRMSMKLVFGGHFLRPSCVGPRSRWKPAALLTKELMPRRHCPAAKNRYRVTLPNPGGRPPWTTSPRTGMPAS